MTKLSRKIRHPSRFLDDAPDVVTRPMRTIARRPYASTGGLLLLLLGVVGLIAIFPEIHREVRIMRM
jgi:hypothetical protein